MGRVCWIAVDERLPEGSEEAIADVLSLAPGQFSGVALPLDLDVSAMRLSTAFGVAVVPVILTEQLADRTDAVLGTIAALASSGAMTADPSCPPVVLIRPHGRMAGDSGLLSRLRQALKPIGTVRIGRINNVGALTSPPPGFDFSVDWPPSVAESVPGQTPQVDALDLAIQTAVHHAGDGALAHSVLLGTGTEGSHEMGKATVTNLLAPVEQLWLDSARRFAANRLGFGTPYVFVRVVGHRHSCLPSWLRGFLDRATYSSWQRPEPAEPVRAPDKTEARARIAIVVHLYYPDLWPEFLAVVEAMPEPADVYISTPLLIAGAVRARVVRDLPDAIVFGVRNIGRDVLPFLHVLRDVGVDRYQYVLKLHSKKSMHMSDDDRIPVLGGGESWRREAIEELAGSRARVSALLGLMDADDDVGLIAPAGQLFGQTEWRCGTGNLMEHLHRGLDIQGRANVFAAGTMFWIRPNAIARLLSADTSLLDFEREAGQVDGTLHHAIERTLAHAAVAEGYRLVDTSASTTRSESP